MKKNIILLLFFCDLAQAQLHDAPAEISWKGCINKRTIIKAIGDPVCAPTAVITFCTYNVCNLPYPYACALGAGSSCIGVCLATQADESTFDYYSVRALAGIKQGWYCLFPCMKEPISVTKKTE